MNNHFTIIVDSCNHEDWIEKCLNTCLTQKYDNYEVILMDAKSDDKTFEIAKRYASDFKNFKVYQNEVRLPQVANFLLLTELSIPGTICVSIDSDDWLKHSQVLAELNDVYNSGDVWMTYGLYVEYKGNNEPLRDVTWHYKSYPDDVIKNNSFREYAWLASHLRTWRRELLLKIKQEDLKLWNKEWLDTTGDQAIMLPMLEMAAERSRYVSKPNYVYNTSNVDRDSAKNEKRQVELEKYIRTKKKYQRIDNI